MLGRLALQFWADARHFQIAALGALLAINFAWLDFGARPLASALALAGALATQAACSRLFGLPHIDLRSPLITGLSLSLLLRADEPWLHAAAGTIAILSKFLLRIEGNILRHAWQGNASCAAADQYRGSLPIRFQQEAINLSRLTGWSADEIRGRMELTGQSLSGGK